MHDAVHDNLTGLPNRELFLNRLDGIISIAKGEETIKPTVFIIDLDRFKQVNDGLGISAGDTILLTIARRLHRLLKPRDSLSRIAGDQFAFLLLSEQEPARIAAVADAIKQAIREAFEISVRGALAMGLRHVSVDGARVLSDAVVLALVATDEVDDADDTRYE